MNAWAVVLIVGAVSLAIRALPMLTSDAVQLGRRTQQGLRHAGIGAMAALLVTALVPHGKGSTHQNVAVLAAVALAALMSWRRSSILRVVAVGAAVYLALVGVLVV